MSTMDSDRGHFADDSRSLAGLLAAEATRTHQPLIIHTEDAGDEALQR